MNRSDSTNSTAQDQSAPKSKRRRRLGILLAVFVVLLAWMGWILVRTGRQEQVVRKIQELGGRVVYNYRGHRVGQPDGPAVVRKLFGDQYYVTLTSVHLRKWRMNPQDLANVAEGLEQVGVRSVYVDTYDFGDAIVEPLKSLKSAKRLFIKDDQLTEAGFKQLKESLPDTQVKQF